MRIKSSIMLGILLSFMTLCAVRADNLLTSKDYVDARDALKQDKITAGTMGSVVTYAGEVDGYAQFGEMPVNDGSFMLGSNTNELATTGLLVAPYLFLNDIDVIQPDEVLVRAEYGGGSYVEGLAIFPSDGTYNAGTDAGKLATMGAVMASMASSGSQPALSGTEGAIVTYGASAGATGERAILDGQYAAGNSDNIPTAGAVAAAVQTIGNQPISVMECANPECTLWNISQRTVLSPNNNAPYSGSAFVNPNDYTGYTPSNP